jgi:hypothetical protein
MRVGASGGALLALLVAGAALRIAVTALTFPPRPGGDELYYVGTAVNIAEGHGHLFNQQQRAFRPPAWSWLLSWLVDVDLRRARLDADTFLPDLAELDRAAPDPDLRDFLRPLLRAPLILSALLVPLTALLGHALFGARTGLLAGAAAAAFPTLVAFGHYLLSETLFAVLLSAGLVLAVVSRDRGGAAPAAAAGLCFGAATLTRELGALIAGVCALWIAASQAPQARRAAAGRGALLCLCTLLVVAPWTWRNHATFGRLVPVSTVGWFAAGEGNTLEHPDWLDPFGAERLAFKIRFFSLEDEMQRVDYARAYTLERIRAEQPLWLPRKLVRNLGLLLTPDSVLLEKIRNGVYGEPGGAGDRALLLAHVLFYGLVICGAALGVARARGPGRRSLALAVLGAVCALHVATNATPRFRVPWLPFLMVYASHAALGWREGLRPGARRALLAPLAALLFLSWAAATWFGEEAAAVWSGPDGPQRPLE